MHLIRVYMVEITDKEMYHAKVAVILRIITNISYMCADNLTLIYACLTLSFFRLKNTHYCNTNNIITHRNCSFHLQLKLTQIF